MANHKNIVPFIKKYEGGLSRAYTDTASSYPCPYLYKGVWGYHTNKGITWQTFESSIGHYPERFFAMNDQDWSYIYKKKYWDKFNLDSVSNQAWANIVVSWAWGSGVGGSYVYLAKFCNKVYGSDFSVNYSFENAKELVQYVDGFFTGGVFLEFCDERERLFKAFNQPANESGWLRRLEAFKEFHNGSFGVSILGIVGILVAFLYFMK